MAKEENALTVDEQTLSRLVPISGLTPKSIAQLAQKATVEVVKRGQYLFRKGDEDGLTTYLLEGELELFADESHVERVQGGSQTARHPVAQLQPRQYSARARTECKVIQIQRKLLDQLLALDQSGGYEVSEIEVEEDDDEGGDWMSRLLQSELFQKIPTANIQKIFLHVEKVEVAKDDVIVQQGDDGDYYYFIAEGRCAVTRRTDEGREIKLAELRQGDSFGEEALIRDTKRNATITMLTDGVLMRLTKDDFAELIRKPLLRTINYAQGCGMVKLGARWIDVRTPEEYEQGAIADSLNLPLPKIRKEAERLEKNRTYILYCDSGGRSSVAAFLLNQLGFDVSYLARGLDSCPQALPAKNAEPAATAKPAASAQPEAAPTEARLPTLLIPASGQSVGKRDNQEDACAVVELDDEHNAVLLVVADGMGGHAAGEIASKAATAAFCDRARAGFGKEPPPDLMRSALQAGNDAIKAKTQAQPDLQGMGCTLVAVLASEHHLWWVSVGDSHLYLIRDRQLRKCNADHSYGGYLDRMAEAGQRVEPDPRYARNMLMSALTGEPIPEIDVSDAPLELELGDRLLLASDGVNSIGEGALIQHAAWSATAEEYTQSLLKAVADADKPRQDNTTVVALDVVDREKQLQAGAEVKKKQRAADEKVIKLNQQLSDASKKLAAALRQKAEAEAARQSAEELISERMRKLETQDDETRKAYENQLREEQARREQEIAEANASLEEAQRQRLAAEEARRQAEAHADRVRAEEEEMRRRLQAEAEERLAAERKKMEAEFARFSQQIEEAQRAREQAEQQLQEKEARLQEESRAASERMAEAERLRVEAEETRRKIEEDAQRRLEEAKATEARERQELEARLKKEQDELAHRLAKAEEIRQQAEAARQKAEEQARRRLEEASQADGKERAELEKKLKQEQELLAERLAVAEKVRKEAEAAREKAEEEARRELERLNAAEAEQRKRLEEELKQKEAELEARLANSSTELEQAQRLREEAESARRQSEEEAARVRAESEAQQARLQAEAETRLREERSRMEAEFAATVDQLEEAKRMQEEAESARVAAEEMVRKMRSEQDDIEARARAEAEEKLRTERARLEEEFGAAKRAVEEAKRIRQEAEDARIAIEEEAAVAQAQAEAAGETLRKEFSEKLELERAELQAKLEAANAQLQAAESMASEAASAQQQAASEAARIRAAEEQARMQLQAEVEAQLRAEREKHQRELAEARAQFENAEQTKLEAEARRIAAEQQAANLAEAERKARESHHEEELAALQAERERMQAEIEQANAELQAAKQTLEAASVNNQVAERRAHQLEEAEQEAGRLKDQARGAMEEASGELKALEQELAQAREEAAQHAERTREAEEQLAERIREAEQAKLQAETARQVAQKLRDDAELDRQERTTKKSPLPLVAGLVVALAAGGAAFYFVGRATQPKAPDGGEVATAPSEPTPGTAPSAPVTGEPAPATPVAPTAPVASSGPVTRPSPPPPPPPPLSTYRDTLTGGTPGPEMVRLPGGTFVMGSTDGGDDERPTREVTVAPFSIGIHEVSFADYDQFVRATKRERPADQWGRGSQPVINVTWEDANAYTRWLSQETGKNYRLPSEAEWEYAARGGATGAYWWPQFDDKSYAVCADCDYRNPNPERPVSVEKTAANPYKLHNAAGNVQEWVQDCYMPTYDGAPTDGSARTWNCPTRVLRGGSYLSPKVEVRPAARARIKADARQFYIGFRVARDE